MGFFDAALFKTKGAALERKRIDWVDTGKTIGIILVVCAHNPYVFNNYPELYGYILSFHVPLFFALSGVTIKSGVSWADLSGRVLSLLWVYFVCAFCAIPLVLMRSDAHSVALSDLILGVLYGTGHTMHPGPLWFLPSLATSLVFAVGVIKLIEFLFENKLVVVFVSVVAIFFGAYFLDGAFYEITDSFGWGACHLSGCFWSFDLAVLGGGYIVFGYWFSTQVFGSKAKNYCFMISCLLVFVCLYTSYLPVVDIDSRRFSPWLGSALTSVFGVLFVFWFLSLFSFKWANMIGSATLPILASHQFIQKKFLLKMYGDYSNVGFFGFLLSVIFAVCVAVVFNEFLFKRSLVGSFIFYPKKLKLFGRIA